MSANGFQVNRLNGSTSATVARGWIRAFLRNPVRWAISSVSFGNAVPLKRTCLDVLPSEYWIDDVKQGDYFDVVTDGSSYGPCSFGGAWTYLAGVDTGWYLARRKRHSGLYATLRTLCNGILGSSAHRRENATDAEPLVTASKPSRESAEHSSSCGSTPPSLSRSGIHGATCGTTATQSRNHREAAAPHSRR